MKHFITIIFLFTQIQLSVKATEAQTAPSDSAKKLEYSVAELRHAHGAWDVKTQFLKADGSVYKEVMGSYDFSWVTEDRVLMGVSKLPELAMNSAILFYINEKDSKIEMSSVGPDGKLWIMTGELGGDMRQTEPFETPKGASQLRFTRYNVEENSFESKMEYLSAETGKWIQGNKQFFTKQTND